MKENYIEFESFGDDRTQRGSEKNTVFAKRPSVIKQLIADYEKHHGVKFQKKVAPNTTTTTITKPNEYKKQIDLPLAKSMYGRPSKEKRMDKLKLKFVITILISVSVGIVFTGTVNYFLAILLSNHISDTTTREIGQVQIDYTRSMGQQIGIIFGRIIQREFENTLKVYYKVKDVFQPTYVRQATGSDSIVDHAYVVYTSSTDFGTCERSIVRNFDKMMYFTNEPYTTPFASLSTINLQYLRLLFDTFKIVRSLSQDDELILFTITLFNDVHVAYPHQNRYIYKEFVTTSKKPTQDPRYLRAQSMFSTTGDRMMLEQENFTMNCAAGNEGMMKDIACIVLLCDDLQTPAGCPSLSFGGLICVWDMSTAVSYTSTLSDDSVHRLFMSQLNPTTAQMYFPLFFLNSSLIQSNIDFFQMEFDQPLATSTDAQNYYAQFNRFYTLTNTDYLVITSCMNGADEYQVAISSIIQPFPTPFSGSMSFTTLIKIPSSNDIFSSMLESISSSMTTLLIIGLVLVLILVLFIFCYIYRYSEHVIEPINRLQLQVKRIAQGSLDVNVQNDTDRHWQEIDILFENFEYLNQIIRSGDDNYYLDLSAESLIKYSNAYLMFETLGNRKGMGIVLNNMGNINMKLGRIEEAINSYKEAFGIAERDLIELLFIDNIFTYYEVRPFNGWDPKVKYDFSYNYHFYCKMQQRPKSMLVCTANKGLIESILSNRAYQLARAYLEGYYMSTSQETKLEYLSNCIDYFRLTEKLDRIHSKFTSRTIFTKLKISQALIEREKYYYLQKDHANHELMFFQSIMCIDSSNDQLSKYEQMYELFDENFKNDIPPEILLQHIKLQEGICARSFFRFKTAFSQFTSCLRLGRIYDPYVREQCLKNIREILEQENLLDQAPGLIKLLQNNFEKKQKDVVFVIDFSQSMDHRITFDASSLVAPYDKYAYLIKDGKIQQKDVALIKYLQVFDDFVQLDDRVSLIRFNDNIDIVFELNEKGNNTQYLRSYIEGQFQMAPFGESAVRQAIYTACKLFSKTIPKDHSKWVVVFTDGGDSCSKLSESELMQKLSEGDVHLMIIGCGLDQFATKIFRQACEKTKNGIFIQTNSQQSEIDVAFQAITNKMYGNADLNYNVEAFL